MCQNVELPENEVEERFEDFMRVIMDGTLSCEDDLDEM